MKKKPFPGENSKGIHVMLVQMQKPLSWHRFPMPFPPSCGKCYTDASTACFLMSSPASWDTSQKPQTVFDFRYFNLVIKHKM